MMSRVSESDTAASTVVGVPFPFSVLIPGERVRNVVTYNYWLDVLRPVAETKRVYTIAHGVVIPAPCPHQERLSYRFVLCDDGKVRHTFMGRLRVIKWDEGRWEPRWNA